jgi:hypothetical protein
VACFGRNKEWDDICVRALEESVKRWVLVSVREALEDDWKEARNPSDDFWWEGDRQSVISPLGGFPKVWGDLFGHRCLWQQAGFLRAMDEEHPLAFSWDPWPSSPSPGSPRSWGDWSVGSDGSIRGPYTGWGDD